jgi:phosphoribosyl 1,2-cyclic phosphodiesterase
MGRTLLICDAGTGLRELGIDLLKRGAQPLVGHMFFSHAHWDHIQGFPFFVPAYVPGSTVCVYTAAPGATDMHALLSGQMRSAYFPVDFKDLRANIIARTLDEETRIDQVTVRAFRQHHPGGSYAFAFEADGHKIVYATDNEIDLTLAHADAVQHDLGAQRNIPDDYLAFIHEADLLIADGQYTESEYPAKIGWGHSRVTTVVDAAMQANVKQLAIYHHDPMQTDADVDAKVAACHARLAQFGASVAVFAAREGLEIRVG